MILDVTGIILTPGNKGKECMGNGRVKGVECCCDECDYLMCCLDTHDPVDCIACDDKKCPCSQCCVGERNRKTI